MRVGEVVTRHRFEVAGAYLLEETDGSLEEVDGGCQFPASEVDQTEQVEGVRLAIYVSEFTSDHECGLVALLACGQVVERGVAHAQVFQEDRLGGSFAEASGSRQADGPMAIQSVIGTVGDCAFHRTAGSRQTY